MNLPKGVGSFGRRMGVRFNSGGPIAAQVLKRV
jgi:hypothetical protein